MSLQTTPPRSDRRVARASARDQQAIIGLTVAELEGLLDAAAERGAERALQASRGPRAAARLATAEEVAERFAIEIKTVYRNARAFGGMKVPGTSIWRFDLTRVTFDDEGSGQPSMRSQDPQSPVSAGRRSPRRARKPDSDCQLLPVGRVRRA